MRPPELPPPIEHIEPEPPPPGAQQPRDPAGPELVVVYEAEAEGPGAEGPTRGRFAAYGWRSP